MGVPQVGYVFMRVCRGRISASYLHESMVTGGSRIIQESVEVASKILNNDGSDNRNLYIMNQQNRSGDEEGPPILLV